MILPLLLTLLTAGTPAFASSVTDRLDRAADAALPESERMVAFNQLVMDWKTIRPELEALAKDDDADSRERWIAIRVMGQTGDKAALTPLLALSEDPMPAIRSAASSALGDLGFAEACPRLEALLVDPAIIVRVAAAEALGAIGDSRSVSALAKALSDRSNYYRGSSLWVRVYYVNALGEIGSRSGIAPLIACLDDKDPAVVDAALASLRKIVGYDFAEGRTREEHIEAWRRWAANEKL